MTLDSTIPESEKKHWLVRFLNWIISPFFLSEKDLEIMMVQYDLTTNKIECTNWYGQRQYYFSGKFTTELWNKIKPYCRVGVIPPQAPTVIYIWSGMETKHLAYNEPIDNYLKDEKLLNTGQGFDYLSGMRYGESEPLTCITCKRKFKPVY